LSAVVGRAEIMDAPTPGRIGGTYGGNPLACAAALATIAELEKHDLCARARHIGGYLEGRLRTLQQRYPQIGDVRGLGAMVAAEFVTDPASKNPAKEIPPALIAACFRRGLLIIAAGIFSNVVRFLPPLVVTDEQLEKGADIFAEALEEVLGK
jgi:4-aminobutyrate aminotransferase/(S)-3-amino-2-methylpropionate transaminase